MPSNLASDLRSEAKSYKRDKDHRSKWNRGSRPAAGTRCGHSFTGLDCFECARRPRNRDSDRDCGRHFSQRTIDNKHPRKQYTRVFVDAGSSPVSNASDNSSDDDVIDPSAAPVPEHEVMYSYDACSGPSAGQDLLSNAVTQAVKRFENKQTEKLVKDEYDLVLDAKDDVYAGDAEDDFEVISHEHLE